MRKYLNLFRFVNTHPLTRKNIFNALVRIFKWQVLSRMYPIAFVMPFVEDSKLIIKRGMTGASGNLYAGLNDFEDMAFLLHLLIKEDLFGDIGANIGVYTIFSIRCC